MWGEYTEDSKTSSSQNKKQHGFKDLEGFKIPEAKAESIEPQKVEKSENKFENLDVVERLSRDSDKVPDSFFKSQQKDEQDLSEEQRREILEKLDPVKFLNKFSQFFEARDFEKFISDSDENISRLATKLKCDQDHRKVTVKNRRYKALQNMLKDKDDFFSKEEMKNRNPLLYARLVGKFDGDTRPDRSSNVTLTGIILNHVDSVRNRKVKAEQEKQENLQEFDSDSDGGETDEESEAACEVTEEQELSMWEEFRRLMYESFLDGKEGKYFDYSKVDDSSDFDDLDELDRDREDAYFDSD